MYDITPCPLQKIMGYHLFQIFRNPHNLKPFILSSESQLCSPTFTFISLSQKKELVLRLIEASFFYPRPTKCSKSGLKWALFIVTACIFILVATLIYFKFHSKKIKSNLLNQFIWIKKIFLNIEIHSSFRGSIELRFLRSILGSVL